MVKQKTISKNLYFCEHFSKYFLIYVIIDVYMAFLVIKNLPNIKLETSMQVSILKNLQLNFIDFMHACGGKGRCVTCKMQVLEGENMLSALTNAELNFREQKLLKNTERLACQAYVCDFEDENIVISVPKETQLPHLEYLD